METQTINISNIKLVWSCWYPWNTILNDSGNNIAKLPIESGVYEVKYNNSDARLTIGKASNLRFRVKQCMIKGNSPHSTGKRMKSEKADFSNVIVRWAITDRPACIEEELHRIYENIYHGLPKYTKVT